MTVAAELLVNVKGVDVNAVALLQRVQVQGLAANTVGTRLTGTFNSLSSAASQFGIALGAGAIAKEVIDLAQLGARAASARDSFTNLAKSAGTTADALIGKMHAAAAGTVSDTQLMISANTGLLLVGEKIAGALPKILEIARAAAKATGQDVSFLYDSLVRGIARGSPRIIDNAGITLDAAAAMDTYAASIGKTADALTSSEQQQATLNAVLTTGQGFIDKIGLSTDSAAVKMQRAQAATDNFKAALGERLAPAIATVAEGLTNLLSKGDLFANASGGADQAQATITKQAASYDAYVKRVAAANQQLRDELGKTDPVFAAIVKGLDTLTPAQFAYARSLIATGVAEGDAVAQAQKLGSTAQLLATQLQAVGGASTDIGRVLNDAGAGMLAVSSFGPEATSNVLSLSGAFTRGEFSADQFRAALAAMQGGLAAEAAAATAAAGAAQQADAANQGLIDRFGIEATVISQATSILQAHIAQLDQDATKAQIDTTASQELAIRKEFLAQQALLAANALIASGNAGAATAAKLAASSSLVDQLTAAYLRLRAAQVATNNEALKAQTGQQLIGPRGNEGDVRTFKHEQAIEDRKQMTAASAAAAAAEREYQRVLGNTGPALARANAELAQLPKGTEAYYNKLIEIQKLKEQQLAAGRKAGGAAHLSDQAKLNNTLLNDAAKTDDQLEAAERAHGQRMFDIERKFQKASLEQQRENEGSKRESRASFYKTLNVDNRDLSKKVRDDLAAGYEQAFAKAQELAQSGNASLASSYLKLKQQQLAAEAQFQKDVAAAQKDKDPSLVKALQEARELERQAELEREKQLLAGGDPDVKARTDALEDEARNFGEQQGKIKTASDDATQRKIDNALREGKDVDALNLRYQQQEEILKRIGTSPPAPGTQAGGAGTAPPPTTTAPSTPGAPVDLAALQAALQGMADQVSAAIASAGNSIVAAEQGTTRAVRAAAGDRAVI